MNILRKYIGGRAHHPNFGNTRTDAVEARPLNPLVFTAVAALISILNMGCGQEQAREVSMSELQMQEDGRYFFGNERRPFTGIGIGERNVPRTTWDIERNYKDPDYYLAYHTGSEPDQAFPNSSGSIAPKTGCKADKQWHSRTNTALDLILYC